MEDILKKPFAKYFLCGSIYFSEGLVFALLTVIVPVYLYESGLSLSLTTLVTGLIGFPWIIKFVWGGLVDHFIYWGRKQFIVLGALLGALGLIFTSFINPIGGLILFTIILVVTDIGTGIFDASADAWAIDISQDYERGKLNGSMQAGIFGGTIAGTAFFGFIAKNFGYHLPFLTGSFLICLIIMCFHVIVQEKIRIKKKQRVSAILLKEFKQKPTQLFLLFAPLSTISSGLLIFTIPLFMNIRFGLDIAQIGLIAAVFPVSRLIGSLLGGFFSDKIGRKPMLYLLVLFNILFSALLIFATTWEMLVIFYGLIGLINGGYYTVILAMLMDATNPNVGATQFSVYTSLMNVGETGIGTISGSLVVLLGFSGVFLTSAWAFGPVLIVLYFLKVKRLHHK
jgi:MFS family permease